MCNTLINELNIQINDLKNELQQLKNMPKRTNALKNAQLKYYNKNKKKITEKNILYNKDYGKREFSCECGSIMPHHSKYKHFKSKKHINFMDAIAKNE